MIESFNWLINNIYSVSDIGRLLSRTYYGSEMLSMEAKAANLLALISADVFAVVFLVHMYCIECYLEREGKSRRYVLTILNKKGESI